MEKFKSFMRDNRKYIIFSSLFFLFSLILISNVPLMGDDWMWGSTMGEEILDQWFEGYNGRYSSNILIMLLTRSGVFRAFFVSLVMLTVVWLPCLFLKKKSLTLISFSSALFLLIPRSVLMKGFLWSAGFAVYTPATVILLIYLVMERDALLRCAPVYSRGKTAAYCSLFAVMGFLGAMFLETATICNLFISFVLPIYVYSRHKRIYPSQIVFFVSTVVGSVFHFGNVENVDGYRVFPTAETIGDTLANHIPQVINLFFTEGFFTFAIMSLLCLCVAVSFIKSKELGAKQLIWVSCGVNIFSLVILYILRYEAGWIIFWGSPFASSLFVGFVASLYCLSVLAVVLFCVRDRCIRAKMTLCLFAAAVTVLPVLVVEPFGSRSIMPAFLCIGVFLTLMLDYIFTEFSLEQYKKIFTSAFICAVCAAFIFVISIYSTIDRYADKRDEYVQKQLELGYSVVTVPRLPYKTYLWCSDLSAPYWAGTYKAYYELPPEIEFKVIEYWEFDAWMAEFDKIQN